MKALSLWQPWATLVALGFKTIETRSWETEYRGPLAIHATARSPKIPYSLVNYQPFIDAMLSAGYKNEKELPAGVIVAIVELVDCMPTAQVRGYISKQEFAFGDYSIGRWAWMLSNIVALPEPVICRGHQRIWNWGLPSTMSLPAGAAGMEE